MKKRVTGIGGFFWKAKSAKKLAAWHRKHPGLPLAPTWSGWRFQRRDAESP